MSALPKERPSLRPPVAGEECLEHGGEDGTAFRNLHRLRVLGLDLLLEVDWATIMRAEGEVDSMQLPDGLAFDEKLGTLKFTKECAVCWKTCSTIRLWAIQEQAEH